MPTGHVIVLTDRPDRGTSLAAEVDLIADCRTVGPEESWDQTSEVMGIIADADLGRPDVRGCLRRLTTRHAASRPPLICLTPGIGGTMLNEAQALGATACLPTYTEPRVVVSALIRQVYPEATITDLVVSRGTARTGSLISNMFKAAQADEVIDMEAVEAGLGCVVNTIHEGGLTRWLDVVWAHDDPTFQHCLLVAGLLAAFAQSLKFSQADQQLLIRGGLVHDIGKAKIPAAILNKPDRLDADEAAVMRTHPVVGYELLQAAGGCDPVSLAVTRHHHEMLDGSGYPDGLSGDEISDPIRLLTICDIYAALIERRAYKPPLPPSEALRILSGMHGRIEGGLVQAFANAITMP